MFFWQFATSSEAQPWWKFFLAIPIGLVPALVLGLIVQTVWDTIKATVQGSVVFRDYLFMLCILAICTGFGWILYIYPDSWRESLPMELFAFILFTVIVLYIRKRYVVAKNQESRNK